MPNPYKGEKKKDFIPRAISNIMKEPGTKSQKHAIAKAFGIWKQKHGESSSSGKLLLEFVKEKCKKKRKMDEPEHSGEMHY